MIHIIDLHFQGRPGTIAAFLVETSEGPVLVESGPATTLDALEEGVRRAGHALTDIQHVLLTHIHFDHAGAAWRLAEHGATIHIHPFGADHLADPEVLWKSAKRIYGDAMEGLWGEMHASPAAQIHACEDGQTITLGDQTFTAWHTPGHAKHHIAWQLGEALFTGDIAGVSLKGGPVRPPCPPPDIDLEAWAQSIHRLRACEAQTLYLTHFGKVTDIAPHLIALEHSLQDWCGWMEARVSDTPLPELIPMFEAYVAKSLREHGLSQAAIADYEIANPAFMSVSGLSRYLYKRDQRTT
ncbi:MAG: glyoxylase-like metal-dependent hydrolase (beta-lactamase superfamily II) [Verrucomicrobiales bacterium]|jgi:glyoxylase-like metal-dependent hydrolase (beta-lactamase superfamily II)